MLDHLREIAGMVAHPDAILLHNAARTVRAVLEPHLQREEREVFPAARKLFGAADLVQMSDEIAARRRQRDAASF